MFMYNGELVTPKNNKAPSISSVGIGLGRIPRFGGQTEEWYPVLAHVIVCALMAPPEEAIHLLLHDAPEVCVSDVPTPWKTAAARKREDMILSRIYRDLGLKWPLSKKSLAKVKEIDAKALAAEAHALGHPKASHWPTYDQNFYDKTIEQLQYAGQFRRPDVASKVYEGLVEQALAQSKNLIVIR